MQDGRPFRKVPAPPTARELLHDILSPSADGPWVSAASELAARVEKVLAYCKQGRTLSAVTVERILNGEE